MDICHIGVSLYVGLSFLYRACLDQRLIAAHHADRPLYKLGLQPIPWHAEVFWNLIV